MQDDGNGLRPLEFYSRKMTPAETRYITREQELLAIKDALRHWRHYLLPKPFSIYSDHESLKYIKTQKEPKGKLARWLDYIQQFNFGDIKYLPGARNPVADALSRPPISELAVLNTLDGSLTLCNMNMLSVPTHTLRTQIQQALPDCLDF
jgi:hypothetical protein